MPRNLELKARIMSRRVAIDAARGIGARRSGTLLQKDTFLLQGDRRLKLRQERGRRPELIYYCRPDRHTRGGRWSSFVRVPLSTHRWVLSSGLWAGVRRVVVRKERLLYMHPGARIHIDTVERLGSFVEFEVVVRNDPSEAKRLLRDLVAAFRIGQEDIIPGAYADLLLNRLQP